MKPQLQLVINVLLSFSMLIQAVGPALAENTEEQLLHNIIDDGSSFISAEARWEIYHLLISLSGHHRSAFTEETEAFQYDESDLTGAAIGFLADNLPESEKIILFTLKRQQEKLKSAAASPKAALPPPDFNPQKLRVRKQTERVFFHYGDRYYTELASTIHLISRYQNHLMNDCRLSTTLDDALKISPGEVEDFVINELQTITDNARMIDDRLPKKSF